MNHLGSDFQTHLETLSLRSSENLTVASCHSKVDTPAMGKRLLRFAFMIFHLIYLVDIRIYVYIYIHMYIYMDILGLF